MNLPSPVAKSEKPSSKPELPIAKEASDGGCKGCDNCRCDKNKDK